MASSRAMRRSSRMSSPMEISVRGNLPIKKEAQALKEQGLMSGGWTEPPLRTPAPSFEDYKGLERHGVLEHMAPLGTLPSQKVKLRLKAYDHSRRPTHVRNGELPVTKVEVNTPETTPPIVSRRSEPRKVEDRPSKLSSSREREEDQDYKPKSIPKGTALRPNPQLSPLGNSNQRLSGASIRLKEVVDSAVERSRHLGNPILGLAIKKLWEESLHNRTLAELLDSVLSGKTTSRQTTDFQTYIKIARKQIKLENRGITHSPSHKSSTTNLTTKSPSKSARRSVARQFDTQNDLSDATGPNNKSQNSKLPSSRQHAKDMEINGTSKDERPAKRLKRSRSASSLSSLSSLSSVSIDQDFAPSVETDQATIHASAEPITNSSTPQSLHGPRLHNFSTTSLLKRPCDASELSTDDQFAKRRKLQKTFEDFTVNESGIRVAPAPTRQSQLMFSLAPTVLVPSGAQQQQQPNQQRLRNGVPRRGNRDDFEDIQSPASSVPQDLVLPPLADARSFSRGGTPNQLGRPSKPVRKGARVKISPTKKRTTGATQNDNGTVTPTANGATVEENLNNDNCESCGFDGIVVCCDSCPKVYHPKECLDPPVDYTAEQAWYCNECLERQNPTAERELGMVTSLDSEMNKVNTKLFLLNEELREYFEGVKTRHDKDYEWDYGDDTVTPKTKTRGGYEEIPDNLKLKDSKENVILCSQCGLSSMGGREIVDCDLCNAHWHLDCLDPPLAKHTNQKSKSNWTCPIHIELGMTRVNGPKPFGNRPFSKAPVEAVTFSGIPYSNALELNSTTSLLPSTPAKALPGASDPGREYQFRRAKNWKVSATVQGRGAKNNGVIAIENDPSDGEDEPQKPGFVARVPETGIKLDFIDRVKNGWVTTYKDRAERTIRDQKQAITDLRKKLAAKATTTSTVKAPPPFERRPFIEQQTALNLARLSQTNTDLGLSPDKVTELINTLITEAPDALIAYYQGEPIDPSPSKGKGKAKTIPPEVEQGPDNSLPDDERRFLLALNQLIKRKLNGTGSSRGTS